MRIGLDEALKKLQEGEVIAIPTDTVYGLAVDFRQPQALEKIYAMKRRSPASPLLLLASSPGEIISYLPHLPEGFAALASAFWPGALSLIVKANCQGLPEMVCAEDGSVGFRVPNSEIALSLLRQTGPLAVTSANRSGATPLLLAEEIEAEFGSETLILEGESPASGLGSTILQFEKRWKLKRQGPVTPKAIAAVLGYLPSS